MAFAQVGPITALMESAAGAVGAGIILGALAAGLLGLALGWPRRKLETRIPRDGYVGGAVGVLAMLADITLRYAF